MPSFQVLCPVCKTPRKVGANNLVQCTVCKSHYSVDSNGRIKTCRPAKK